MNEKTTTTIPPGLGTVGGLDPAESEQVGRSRSMGKAPSFQFYASDFLTDTQTWTDEEAGAHVRLLAWSWVNRRGIPRDFPRMTRISPGAERCWPTIGEKWEPGPDETWINDKLESTRKDNDTFRARQLAKSILAVEARKSGKKKRSRGIPVGSPVGHSTGNPLEDEEEVLFQEFWKLYKYSKKKPDARKAWASLTPEDRAACIAATPAQVANQKPDYRPYPASYLRARQWEDEIVPLSNGKQEETVDGTPASVFEKFRADFHTKEGRWPNSGDQLPKGYKKWQGWI